MKRYFSQCITVHLFCSPWPTKLANQIRSRPSRSRRLEQPRKGSNLFAAGHIVSKKLAPAPRNAHPVKYDGIKHFPRRKEALSAIRLSRVTGVCDDITAIISAFEGRMHRVSGGDIQRFLAVEKKMLVSHINYECHMQISSLRSTMTCCSCNEEYFSIM